MTTQNCMTFSTSILPFSSQPETTIHIELSQNSWIVYLKAYRWIYERKWIWEWRWPDAETWILFYNGEFVYNGEFAYKNRFANKDVFKNKIYNFLCACFLSFASNINSYIIFIMNLFCIFCCFDESFYLSASPKDFMDLHPYFPFPFFGYVALRISVLFPIWYQQPLNS